MIILNTFCVVLFLGLGVSTPQGNRYNKPFLQNGGNNEFNVERNVGEPVIPYDVNNTPNEFITQKTQTKLYQNEGYDQNNFQHNIEPLSDSRYTHNPSVLINRENERDVLLNNRHVPLNPSLATLTEERNQRLISNEYQREPVLNNYEPGELINVKRNLSNEDVIPEVSYRASPPQVNRIQHFRPNNEENREVSVPSVGDILPELSNHRIVISQSELNKEFIPKVNPISQINHKDRRQNSRVEDLVNSMNQNNEEVGIQIDVPLATPEYINSVLNEYKPVEQRNLGSINGMKNYNNLHLKVQNIEGAFQNPSAEILYKTGRAQPYEISNEQIFDSSHGNARVENILSNTQRLKELYMSSKPSKRYMVVYPDGRVEQVDELERIQKMYPNYVMLHAKELLQKSQPNQVVTPENQGFIKNDKPVVTTTFMTQPISPGINAKNNQLNKVVSQIVKDQITPEPTDIIAGPSENVKNLLSEIKPDNTEAETIKENNVQTPVQEVQAPNENVIASEGTQEQNILSKDVNSGHNENISTTEIPSNEENITTTKNTVATVPAITENYEDSGTPNSLDNVNEAIPLHKNLKKVTDHTEPNTSIDSNENKEAVKNLETAKPELSDNHRNESTVSSDKDLSSDINGSPSPFELSQSTESSDTNQSNKTVNDEGMIPLKNSKNDEESFDNIAPTTESSINSSDIATSTQLSSVNPLADLVLHKPPLEDDNSNITNNTQHLPNGDDDVEGDEVSNSSQPASNISISNQKENGNNSKIQTPDVTDDLPYLDHSASSNHNNPGNGPYEDDSSREEPDSNGTSSLSPKQKLSQPNDDSNTVKEESIKGNPSIPTEGGLTSSNNEDSSVPVVTSNDSNDQNSTETPVEARGNEGDDDKGGVVPSKSNDFLPTEVSLSSASDENIDSDPSFFNFNESFLKKLLINDDLHNSFYFLFPRPKPNIKETKKTIYPNGTVVIETTETIDAEDGEKTTSKSIQRCVSCKTCENT